MFLLSRISHDDHCVLYQNPTNQLLPFLQDPSRLLRLYGRNLPCLGLSGEPIWGGFWTSGVRHFWYLLAFGLPARLPPASGGGPWEFQDGASSISPPFWFGASSTSVQVCCSRSSNKSGVMQKIIEKQSENNERETSKSGPKLIRNVKTWSCAALGGQGRFKVEIKTSLTNK